MSKLIGQFAPMAGMFKGGNGMLDPMSMVQRMMGGQGSRQFSDFQNFMNQGRNMNPEDFVRQEFSKDGLDLGEVRRTLGF